MAFSREMDEFNNDSRFSLAQTKRQGVAAVLLKLAHPWIWWTTVLQELEEEQKLLASCTKYICTYE